jgi:predicted dehydrogenase
MSIVRIGLAGCGSVSQRGLLPHLAADDIRGWCELTAVMDPVPGRAQASAEKFGARMAFESYDEMLAADIDMVVLASPIGLHYEQAMKAIAAGKHVHLNKTMTTTRAEADEVIAAAAAAGLKIVSSPGNGLHAGNRRIREIVESGEIGRIYWSEIGTAGGGHEFEAFRTGNDVLSNVNPTWYYKKPGGGPMYDMAVYALHRITAILGPVQRVTGMSGIGLKERTFKDETITVEMDDNTHLLLDFGDSVFCLLYGSNSASGPTRPFAQPFISGSEGSITAVGGNLEIWGRNVLGVAGTESGHRTEQTDGRIPFVFGVHKEIPERHVYADIMHLVDCVLNDQDPVVSAEHARHVIEIIELGYKAAETGQTQQLATTFATAEWPLVHCE